MLKEIFWKRGISSIWIKLFNSVYENNQNTTVHKQNTLIHFKPMLHFNTPWKHKKQGALV